MSIKRFKWHGENTQEIAECTLSAHSVFVAFLPLKSESNSLKAFSVLIESEVIDPSVQPDFFGIPLFLKKLVSEQAFMNNRYEYRMIGNPKHFEAIQSVINSFGIQSGKHVPFLHETRLQFIPSERRIRVMATAAISSEKIEKKIRVLVVDDSETIRKLLFKIFSESTDLECVGTVADPLQAAEAIRKLKPDVITLDIHMPGMDGVTLLKKLMPEFKIPSVMISSLSKEEGTSVLEALESGAVDYIQKPSMAELPRVATLILEKVRSASKAKIQITRSGLEQKVKVSLSGTDFSYLICIGSSTGGTEALKSILTRLPDQVPPILIVQHIPAVFSKAFADRMNSLCAFEVKEAENGDLVKANRVLIAPGGFQMKVKQIGSDLKVFIEDSAPVNRHKPSVDFTFLSVLELKRKKILAMILTGMGADGAKGLLALKKQGAETIAQNEESCVVYGMPREAVKLGAADHVLHLNQIPEAMMKSVSIKERKVA